MNSIFFWGWCFLQYINVCFVCHCESNTFGYIIIFLLFYFILYFLFAVASLFVYLLLTYSLLNKHTEIIKQIKQTYTILFCVLFCVLFFAETTSDTNLEGKKNRKNHKFNYEILMAHRELLRSLSTRWQQGTISTIVAIDCRGRTRVCLKN